MPDARGSSRGSSSANSQKSLDSDDPEREKKKENSKKKKAAAESSDEDNGKQQMEVRDPKTNRIITLTKTVYGCIELNFENTKIIRNGKILDLNEADNPENEGTTVEQLSKANTSSGNQYMINKQLNQQNQPHPDQKKAQDDPMPMTSIQNSYAVDIGKFKAGMDEVDRDEVKRVIEETSMHSEFYKTQETKLRQVEQKVKRYLHKLRNYKSNKPLWAKTKEIVKKAIESYVNKRETRRTWFHIDLDMFYAACEIRDNPSLSRKPVAVGDNSMIQTTNYIARKYGVKSAMPGFIGRKLCPQLVFVKPNYVKYRQVSDDFKRILQLYDPKLESCGLDEANLDLTEYLT